MNKDIVLIHGLFGSLNAPEIIAPFSGHNVHAPDLLGYGIHADFPTNKLTLQDQARHVTEYIQREINRKVDLVGHSVGGAVAALIAFQSPELVSSYASVEGNFTLKDAFWSGQIAKKPIEEVDAIVSKYKNDPDTWISNAGVKVTDFTSRLARDWLENQPGSTIKAQARAVVETTGDIKYLEQLKQLMQSNIPVYLIAGERSSAGWNVPVWANEICTMRVNIPDVGHLIMAESPVAFANAVLMCTEYNKSVE